MEVAGFVSSTTRPSKGKFGGSEEETAGAAN